MSQVSRHTPIDNMCAFTYTHLMPCVGVGAYQLNGAYMVLSTSTDWLTQLTPFNPTHATINHTTALSKQGLRRCAAMVRKFARQNAMLVDAKDYDDALKVEWASSFNDNGLAPLPSKVQEAVQSCAELKVTAARALGGPFVRCPSRGDAKARELKGSKSYKSSVVVVKYVVK